MDSAAASSSKETSGELALNTFRKGVVDDSIKVIDRNNVDLWLDGNELGDVMGCIIN